MHRPDNDAFALDELLRSARVPISGASGCQPSDAACATRQRCVRRSAECFPSVGQVEAVPSQDGRPDLDAGTQAPLSSQELAEQSGPIRDRPSGRLHLRLNR
jgi:hypothetical protein